MSKLGYASLVIVVAIASDVLAAACRPPSPGKALAVPTAEAAIAAAKGAWQSISTKATSIETFKRESVARFEPYKATLTDGVWHVLGTIPAGFHGRVPKALVCESDGSVEARETIQ